MKIAVASQNKKTVTGHAGRCRNFFLYQLEGETVVDKSQMSLTREQTFHETPLGNPHALDGVDVLIAGSMGQQLVEKLTKKNIAAFVTEEPDPDKTIALYFAKELTPAEEAADAHGEHEHSHDDEEE